MGKIFNFLKNYPISLGITVIISFVGITIFLVVFTPESTPDKIFQRITPFIIPLITYPVTRFFNFEKKWNNWINPDHDVIYIHSNPTSLAYEEKRKSIKLKVYKEYHKKIFKQKKVVWLHYDSTIDIEQFLFNLSQKSKIKPIVWYNFNNTSIDIDNFCWTMFDHLKPYFKGKEIEQQIKENPLSLFQYLSQIKTPSLFIFNNFKSFEYDSSKIKPDYFAKLFNFLSSNKKLLFVTTDSNNTFLKNTGYDFQKMDLHFLNDKANLKKYLKESQISITKQDIDNLLSITNGDWRLVEIFIDLYKDLNAKYNIKKFHIPEIIALLNDFDRFYEFFDKYLIEDLQTSEIDILKFIAVFNFNENSDISEFIISNYLRYSFIDTLDSLCEKQLVYSSVFRLIPKNRPRIFDYKIKNSLYKRYFVALLKNNNRDLYINLSRQIRDHHDNYPSGYVDMDRWERIFYYSLISEDYQFCYDMINIFNRDFRLNPINYTNIMPEQEVYDFVYSKLILLPLDNLAENQTITIRVIKVKILYQYYLWRIEEEKNITYCFNEMIDLFNKCPENPLVLEFYSYIIWAYNSYKGEENFLPELESVLNKLITDGYDKSFYQLLLSKLLYLKGENLTAEQLLKTSLQEATDRGNTLVMGQILDEISRKDIENGNIAESINNLKKGVENSLLNTALYSIAYSKCDWGIALSTENNLFDELEYFNTKKVEISIYQYTSNQQYESEFEKIFMQYNSGNHEICIRLCEYFYDLIVTDEQEEEKYNRFKLNCYIFNLDSLISLKEYDSAKQFYNEKINDFHTDYLAHIFSKKYLSLIDSLSLTESLIIPEEEWIEWIDEGIKTCDRFKNDSFYLFKKAEYLIKQNKVVVARILLEKILRNKNTNDKIKKEAKELLSNIKEDS